MASAEMGIGALAESIVPTRADEIDFFSWRPSPRHCSRFWVPPQPWLQQLRRRDHGGYEIDAEWQLQEVMIITSLRSSKIIIFGTSIG